MKEDEIRFFRTCWKHRAFVKPRHIIDIVCEFINYKRCYYLLEKWSRLGFYEWGVNIGLGWFEPDKMPERYKVLLEE